MLRITRPDKTIIKSFGPGSKPLGKTIGEWTVLWWQWALSIPKSTNPVVDMSGKYASFSQIYNVFFLAGRFGSEGDVYPQRSCTVPYGRPILFPVLNCEANRLEYPFLTDDRDLIDHVERDIDGIIRKECFIDDEVAPIVRIRSDPSIFPLNICRENGLGVQSVGMTRAAADGYWVFLEWLSKGPHSISFRGSCEQGRLKSGADYNVHII